MENGKANEANANQNRVDITHLSSGEARDYIEEMKAAGNTEALHRALIRVNGRLKSIGGGVGEDYEYQQYIYLIGELEKALGPEPNVD